MLFWDFYLANIVFTPRVDLSIDIQCQNMLGSTCDGKQFFAINNHFSWNSRFFLNENDNLYQYFKKIVTFVLIFLPKVWECAPHEYNFPLAFYYYYYFIWALMKKKILDNKNVFESVKRIFTMETPWGMKL